MPPYLAAAALWTCFSHDLHSRLTRDPNRIAALSKLKGWGVVAVTGVLLGGLPFRLLRRLDAASTGDAGDGTSMT